MDQIDLAPLYLAKAAESLAGAESEFVNGRYNNCANRCYYACFQAALSALVRSAIYPSGFPTQWGHGFVRAQFSGNLIGRRKLFPAELRDTLERTSESRVIADYQKDAISSGQAERLVRRARGFVRLVGRSEENLP